MIQTHTTWNKIMDFWEESSCTGLLWSTFLRILSRSESVWYYNNDTVHDLDVFTQQTLVPCSCNICVVSLFKPTWRIFRVPPEQGLRCTKGLGKPPSYVPCCNEWSLDQKTDKVSPWSIASHLHPEMLQNWVSLKSYSKWVSLVLINGVICCKCI